MRIIILICLLFSISFAKAQVSKSFHNTNYQAMFLQHGDNKFWYNPAAIAEDETKTLTFITGVNSTSNGYISALNYQLPTKTRKNSFAFQLSNQQKGTFTPVDFRNYYDLDTPALKEHSYLKGYNFLEGSFMYSRTFYIGAENKLSFGAEAVLKRFSYRLVEVSNADFNTYYQLRDPIYKPDINIGMQVSRNKFYAGVSLRNILKPYFMHYVFESRPGGGANIFMYTVNQRITAFITAGNTFTLGDKLKLKSSLLIATDQTNMYAVNLDLNNTIIYKNKSSLGISLRDASIYNQTMYNKFGGYNFIGTKSFSFNNFALNTGYKWTKLEFGAAFNFQNYTNADLSVSKGFKLNAAEIQLKFDI